MQTTRDTALQAPNEQGLLIVQDRKYGYMDDTCIASTMHNKANTNLGTYVGTSLVLYVHRRQGHAHDRCRRCTSHLTSFAGLPFRAHSVYAHGPNILRHFKACAQNSSSCQNGEQFRALYCDPTARGLDEHGLGLRIEIVVAKAANKGRRDVSRGADSRIQGGRQRTRGIRGSSLS